MLHRIQGTITAIEGSQAVCVFGDNQQLRVPLAEIGSELAVGAVLVLTIAPESEARLATEDLARTMLNQLISNVPITPAKAETDEEKGA